MGIGVNAQKTWIYICLYSGDYSQEGSTLIVLPFSYQLVEVNPPGRGNEQQ
ncbi:hypothetical protein BBO01nite_45850 [Brevibacillus borstelensis]|jgi:hypothetical protein|nr:hypothetical protein BBO01nite_45850 [Brevibacillus borstelensis]